MGQTVAKKTPKQLLRENKRMIKRAIRDLVRERRGLEKQEKNLIKDIKKNAKANQIEAVKIMAKDLVRARNFVQKFHKMESQMNAVALQLEMCKSTEAMTRCMKKMTKSMVMMNRRTNIPQMQKVMRRFQMEQQKQDMTQEMMGDMMDEAMDDADAEENEEAIVSQVLDEIGVSMAGEIPDAASGSLAAPTGAVAATSMPAALPMALGGGGGGGGGGGRDPSVDDLEARLANLKK